VADALKRLAPAVGRAAVYGEPVTVNVVDRRAAEIFRLALARSACERATDRLVRIVVAGE
jgi:N-acetylglucosamine kinase-like BadF-type ATPase